MLSLLYEYGYENRLGDHCASNCGDIGVIGVLEMSVQAWASLSRETV